VAFDRRARAFSALNVDKDADLTYVFALFQGETMASD
jgi:hypothetical protein